MTVQTIVAIAASLLVVAGCGLLLVERITRPRKWEEHHVFHDRLPGPIELRLQTNRAGLVLVALGVALLFAALFVDRPSFSN